MNSFAACNYILFFQVTQQQYNKVKVKPKSYGSRVHYVVRGRSHTFDGSRPMTVTCNNPRFEHNLLDLDAMQDFLATHWMKHSNSFQRLLLGHVTTVAIPRFQHVVPVSGLLRVDKTTRLVDVVQMLFHPITTLRNVMDFTTPAVESRDRHSYWCVFTMPASAYRGKPEDLNSVQEATSSMNLVECCVEHMVDLFAHERLMDDSFWLNTWVGYRESLTPGEWPGVRFNYLVSHVKQARPITTLLNFEQIKRETMKSYCLCDWTTGHAVLPPGKDVIYIDVVCWGVFANVLHPKNVTSGTHLVNTTIHYGKDLHAIIRSLPQHAPNFMDLPYYQCKVRLPVREADCTKTYCLIEGGRVAQCKSAYVYDCVPLDRLMYDTCGVSGAPTVTPLNQKYWAAYLINDDKTMRVFMDAEPFVAIGKLVDEVLATHGDKYQDVLQKATRGSLDHGQLVMCFHETCTVGLVWREFVKRSRQTGKLSTCAHFRDFVTSAYGQRHINRHSLDQDRNYMKFFRELTTTK